MFKDRRSRRQPNLVSPIPELDSLVADINEAVDKGDAGPAPILENSISLLTGKRDGLNAQIAQMQKLLGVLNEELWQATVAANAIEEALDKMKSSELPKVEIPLSGDFRSES